MGDSMLSSMGFNRSNLNQDVARVVAEQGKLNYPQVLETCYPARPLTPLRFKESHLKARRVKCVFVGPNDKVPVRCPRGYDLLAVMGLGFTRRETEDIIELLEKAKVGSSVILGIPEQPLPGSAQLKELQALNVLAAQEPYTLPVTLRICCRVAARWCVANFWRNFVLSLPPTTSAGFTKELLMTALRAAVAIFSSLTF